MEQKLTVKEFISCLNEQKIGMKDLEHFLQSRHSHLVEIFQAILNHPSYKLVAKKIVEDMISNMYKMISSKLELYIIQNIWKHEFLALFHHESIKIKQEDKSLKKTLQTDIFTGVYMFLCQKMRSLKFQTRLSALKSFQQLLKSLVGFYSSSLDSFDANKELSYEQAQGFDKFMSHALKRMLKKQQLAKSVSYNQGLFLQLLEDQFHQIRVTTLAVLELISLKTPYFYSLEVEYGENQHTQLETLQSLKQTILYMLNDEHQLVRERSLVAIFRISEAKSENKNIQVFSLLSRQDIFTILMCLRQNNSVLRQKVYECLKVLNLNTIDQLLLILEKLFQTLLIYKQDKTKIYLLLKSYSKTQSKMIVDFIDKNPKQNIKVFYDFHHEQQPNCKNIIYKGKIILLRQTVLNFVKGKMGDGSLERYANFLPGYIVRHLSYVEDTQFKLKLCETLNENNESVKLNPSNLTQQIQQSSILQTEAIIVETQKEKIDHLTKLKSILNYEYNLTENDSFQNSFLLIILNAVEIILIHLENRKEKKQDQKHRNLMEEQNIRDSSWFDVIDSDKANKKNFQEEISAMTKVDQSEIEKLLYENSYSKNKNDFKDKSIELEISQTLFEIETLRYIYSLDQMSNISLKAYYSINLIKSILSSIEKSLKNFNLQSICHNKLYEQIEQYLRTLVKKQILKEKRFKIRPISIGRNSLGTGYSDKLLIMVEHPQRIRDKKDYQYHNPNIWLKILTVRTQFNAEKQQFRPSEKCLVYYVKFQNILTLSEMRPLIDYNQNKTIYSAELPLNIVDSKESLLLKFLKNSPQKESKHENQPKPKTKKADEINVEKYIDYQEREIVVKSLAIIFVSSLNVNKQQKSEKILAEWSAGNDTS